MLKSKSEIIRLVRFETPELKVKEVEDYLQSQGYLEGVRIDAVNPDDIGLIAEATKMRVLAKKTSRFSWDLPADCWLEWFKIHTPMDCHSAQFWGVSTYHKGCRAFGKNLCEA